MSVFDKYDEMSGPQLKYEAKKRGLPIQKNLAKWKFRVVLRLDDNGKISESLKYLPKNTRNMPDFEDLLTLYHNKTSPSVHESPVPLPHLEEDETSSPSVP